MFRWRKNHPHPHELDKLRKPNGHITIFSDAISSVFGGAIARVAAGPARLSVAGRRGRSGAGSSCAGLGGCRGRASPGGRAREERGPPVPGGGGRRDRKGLVRALGFRPVHVPRRQTCACAPLRARVGAVLRTGGAVPRDAMWRPLRRASVRVAAGPTRTNLRVMW